MLSLLHCLPLHNYSNHCIFKKTNFHPSSPSPPSSCIVYAVGKDSKQYEIDKDKARKALQKLDLQLQELSDKQASSPKINVSEVKITEETIGGGEEEMVTMPELSGSFLASITILLFIFTIFYNVIYITVINPIT